MLCWGYTLTFEANGKWQAMAGGGGSTRHQAAHAPAVYLLLHPGYVIQRVAAGPLTVPHRLAPFVGGCSGVDDVDQHIGVAQIIQEGVAAAHALRTCGIAMVLTVQLLR